jgi:hypothetical protein
MSRAAKNRGMTRKRGVLAPNMAGLKIFGHGDDRHSKIGVWLFDARHEELKLLAVGSHCVWI